MATFTAGMQPVEESRDKGLKTGALGLVSSVVIGVASTAPAYSLAATLFFVVAAVGLKSPLVAVLAFVPMLLCSIGFSELNKADPDCGTTFIWSTRAFGPTVGWAGGWATVAADLLVMGSLAQVAGQYGFFLFQGPKSTIGANASGGWVLLVGVLWIMAMTYICYRGIELSARFQRVLLTIEVVMLMVMSVTALVRVFVSNPPGSLHPSFSWLSPAHLPLSAFMSGIILMLFIYWGWDTALSVNEETADKSRIPGRAGII
jgi:amino acid transporter